MEGTSTLSMKGGSLNFTGGIISGPITIENLSIRLGPNEMSIMGKGCKSVFLIGNVCQNIDTNIQYSGNFTREYAQRLIGSVIHKVGAKINHNTVKQLFAIYRHA